MIRSSTSRLVSALTLPLLSLAACGREPLPTQNDDSPGVQPALALGANSWTAKRAIPGRLARYGLIAAVVPNSAGETILYVLGGHESTLDAPTIVAYNVATNTWTKKSALFKRSYSNGWGVIGGKVYIPGGFDFNGENGFCCDSYRATLWVYDPSRDVMLRKRDMPAATASGLSGVIAGKLYVLAGDGPTEERSRRFYRYNPSTNAWTSLARPPHHHFRGVGGVINGKFYVVGGLDLYAQPTSYLDAYNPSTNTWKTLAPIPSGRGAGGAAVLNGRLYVVGLNGSNRTTYVYDPATNKWMAKASFPTGQYEPSAAVPVRLGGRWRLLAVGGTRVSDGGNAPSQLYTP